MTTAYEVVTVQRTTTKVIVLAENEHHAKTVAMSPSPSRLLIDYDNTETTHTVRQIELPE